MKHKRSSAPRIAFALLVLVTLACGASAEAVATEPAALPDMSVARIFRQQLPGGFEELAPEDFFNREKASGDEEDLPETVFAYVKRDTFQLIIGMSFLLEDSLDHLRFGRDVSDSKYTFKEMADALGGEDLRDQEVIEGMEDLGEKRSAMTMIADVEGVPMRFDGAIFQRDVIGAVIISMTVEGETPRISLEKLGELYDKRLQESLEAAQ